ncbi:hypothetical protein [Nocardia tengchongensis]|uniref:hypothetical protein n=1 Tax=Nocardia tengchongensis TaxID=2055889 RepID=UPI0036D143FB
MSIDPNETHDDDDVLVASFTAQLEQVTDAEQAIAAMDAPRVPTGGRVEDWAKPTIAKVTTWRDVLRTWTPALAGTVVFLILLFSPAPMTGPLIVYAIGWMAFGLWTSLGRPGIRDSAALVARRAVAVWGLLTTAWAAISRLLHRRAEPKPRPATA